MSGPTFEADRVYRPWEVVARGHLPRDAVYQALRNGELKCLRRGPRFLVPGWCVTEWLRKVAI